MKKLVMLGILMLFSLVLSACGPKTYKVVIDPMNGNQQIIHTIEADKRVPLAETPSKEGFVFAGWFNGDEPFTFNERVNEDLVIIAKWNEQNYTITFVSNGGTEIEPVTVGHGKLLSEPNDPIRQNFTFLGWLLDGELFDFNTPITRNMFLYADYEQMVYQVFFDTLGGSTVATQEVVAGFNAIRPSNPTKEGYLFQGWFIGDVEFNFNTAITQPTVLTAKWNEQLYTGYYDGMDGLTGPNLIIFLNALLKEMQGKNYEYAKTALQITDRDPNNSSRLIEFYTGQSYVAAWDGGITWNREHVWPQSKLGQSATPSVVNSASDLHNLTPSNPTINSNRGNLWFGPVTNTYSYLPDRAEIRGDIARILFYMDIRYDNLTLVYLTGNQNPAVFEMGDLATLLQWHIDDPVDDFERNRNSVIFSMQGNRNPFIDHPELVSYIYN